MKNESAKIKVDLQDSNNLSVLKLHIYAKKNNDTKCLYSKHQKCMYCQQGYVLSPQSKCVQKCPYRYYNSQSICQKCQEGCIECIDDQICLQCDQKHYLQDGKCIGQCPDQYFGQNSTRKCINCIKGCQKCQDQNTCQLCNEGLYLLRNSSKQYSCSNLQLSFYFKSDQNNYRQYKSCGQDCIDCLDEKYCTKCKPGSYLRYELKNTYQRSKHNNTNMTFAIQQNETLRNTFSSLTCHNQCESKGEYQVRLQNRTDRLCQKCISNCVQCNRLDQCQKCNSSNNFYINGTSCIKHCFGNTFLNEDKNGCNTCNKFCAKCKGPGQDQCTACWNDLVLNKVTNKCECKETLFYKNGKCVSCDDDGRCLECTSRDDCTKCKEGDKLVDKLPKGKKCDCEDSRKLYNKTQIRCIDRVTFVSNLYKSEVNSSTTMSNILSDPVIISVQVEKYGKELGFMAREQKGIKVLNIIALISVFFGGMISKACLINLQIVTTLSFMEFLSQDSLDFFPTDWCILVPLITNDTITSIKTFRYIFLIQMVSILIAGVVYFFTRKIQNKIYDKEEQDEQKQVEPDSECHQNVKKLKDMICWNLPLYFLVIFMIPSLFLMCFYYKVDSKDHGLEYKVAYVYFLLQTLLILYVHTKMCFNNDSSLIHQYRVVINQYNWIQKSAKICCFFEIFKYCVFYMIIIQIQYFKSLLVLCLLCGIQVILIIIFRPFKRNHHSVLMIYQLLIQILMYSYIIVCIRNYHQHHTEHAKTESRNKLRLASIIYVGLNFLIFIFETGSYLYDQLVYWLEKRKEKNLKEFSKLSIGYLFNIDQDQEQNQSRTEDKKQMIKRKIQKQMDEDYILNQKLKQKIVSRVDSDELDQQDNEQLIDARTINDVVTIGVPKLLIPAGTNIKVINYDQNVANCYWQQHQVVISIKDIQSVDHNDGGYDSPNHRKYE